MTAPAIDVGDDSRSYWKDMVNACNGASLNADCSVMN